MRRRVPSRAAVIVLSALLCAGVALGVALSPGRLLQTGGTAAKPMIVIDPGHGGADGGAVGYDGVVEKNINLQISLKLRTLFQAAGFPVLMTREDDRSIHDSDANTLRSQKSTDLHNRLGIIRANPQALFISIHQNKFEQSQYWGTQVFYSPGCDDSKRLAQSIQSAVHGLIQPENEREIKKADKDLYILYYAKTPAVMVECGFLSNPEESKRLQDSDYQTRMAFSILCGALRYRAGEGSGASEAGQAASSAP